MLARQLIEASRALAQLHIVNHARHPKQPACNRQLPCRITLLGSKGRRFVTEKARRTALTVPPALRSAKPTPWS